MILPSFCYSSKTRRAEGLCVHYFSAIYADPKRWDDPQRAWELFHDLNLPREKEKYGPWDIDLGNGHADGIYASADFMITGKGERIDLVPDTHKSWHAGKSAYRGREDCNSFLAGVELIAAPQVSQEYGFTEGHYAALAELIIEYNFMPMVTTHEAIRREYQQRNPDVGVPNKYDPGPSWDWSRLNYYLNQDMDGG